MAANAAVVMSIREILLRFNPLEAMNLKSTISSDSYT